MEGVEGLRFFAAGAIRDANQDKYEYTGFLDPKVLRAYAAFMHRHRSLPDGSRRDAGNWKLGIDREEYLASLLRHVMDLWELHDYGKAYRHDTGDPIDLVETACAILFNAQGYLFEHLRADPIGQGQEVGSTG